MKNRKPCKANPGYIFQKRNGALNSHFGDQNGGSRTLRVPGSAPEKYANTKSLTNSVNSFLMLPERVKQVTRY